MTEGNGLSFSALAEATIAMHELFGSLVESGFTENQALRLIAHMMAAGKGDDE